MVAGNKAILSKQKPIPEKCTGNDWMFMEQEPGTLVAK